MKKFILFLILTISMSAYATDIPYSFQTATEREDGKALGLSEIKGHHFYYGTAVGDYQEEMFFTGASLPNTDIVITILPAGTFYGVFTTVDIDNRESVYSENYITIVNDAKALPKSPTIPRGQVIKATSTLP